MLHCSMIIVHWKSMQRMILLWQNPMLKALVKSCVQSSREILCSKPPWPAAGVSCELTGQLSSSQGSCELASLPAGSTHSPPTLSFVDTCRKELSKKHNTKKEEATWVGKGLEEKRNTSLRHDQRIISDEHQQRCREIRTQKCRSSFFCRLHCDIRIRLEFWRQCHYRCSCLRSSTSFAWC